MTQNLAELRQHDHDRFLSLLLSPMPQRLYLIALYAFNLEIARIPDLVSEPMMGHIRLQWWRETLEGLGQGETRGHHVAEALHEARIDGKTLLPLIDARERDLEENLFADMDALELYTEQTSAALMQQAATLIAGDEKARQASEALSHAAIAYGLTGLLRAVPFHATQGRIMLPASQLQTHNVDPHEILAGKNSDGLRCIIEEVIKRIRWHLKEASTVRFEKKLMPALLPATLCELYLKVISRTDFDPFTTPVEIPAFRRQLRFMGRMIRRKI